MKTNDAFNLAFLEGAWESVNLNPAVMVYRHYSGTYYLMLISMNEYTHQASTSIYEVEEDETGYFIGIAFNYQRLTYNLAMDTLSLSVFGDYMRN